MEMIRTAPMRLNFDEKLGLAGPALVALLTMLLPQTAQAQGTPAGTTVSNQALLNFEIAGTPQQTLSNNNAVTVQELINVTTITMTASLLIHAGHQQHSAGQ